MNRRPMNPALGLVAVHRLEGSETIRGTNGSPAGTVLDYWRWSASDLVNNLERGIFAEFLVALALDQTDGVRSCWEPYDLRTGDGITVEVKSSAYLQAWPQWEYSTIQFGIGKHLRWDEESNELVGPKRRQAQVYVFCLLAQRDQASLDPLDLAQWEFFILATRTLDREVGDRKQIGLADLARLGARKVGFDGIATAVLAEEGDRPPDPGSPAARAR